MRADEVAAYIQEPDRLEAITHRWQESLAAMPSEPPSFLDPAEFTASRAWAGLPEDLDAALEQVVARIANDPPLLRLAWHAHYLLFDPEEKVQFSDWPVLDRVLGNLHGAFYLLIALAVVPHIRSLHHRMGVPESVTHDTCQVLTCLNSNYGRANPGHPGIVLKELAWVRHHLAGRLFRLGRFEYMLRPFSGPLHAYRHRQTNQVIALAEDGTQFGPDGYRATADGSSADAPGAWRASLASDARRVTGFAVSPRGVALRRRVTLPLDEWHRVLKPGQPVLEMHIPEGGGMTPDRCIDSMRRAFGFFDTYFPDTPTRAVQCHSWIFGPQLEEILPPSANLVQLLRQVYLFPVRHAPNEGLYYIFADDNVDLATAPRATSLQRAVLDFLAAGGRWRSGGMFFLRQDLDRFGTSYYRSRWAELHWEG